MADLSPAAQAMLDAIDSQDGESDRAVVVAALYAAAHHLPNDRKQLAAIADELEAP